MVTKVIVSKTELETTYECLVTLSKVSMLISALQFWHENHVELHRTQLHLLTQAVISQGRMDTVIITNIMIMISKEKHQ